jgi:hypothetical protein
VPQGTYSNGPKQLGTTPSGFKDLVTGRLAGSTANSYDIDGGVTSIRSPDIILPTAQSLTLSFRYYLAHGSNSTSADYLRVTVVGANNSMVFEELGAANNDDGVWAINNVGIDSFAGQKVYLLFTAADGLTDSLVEAAIDDVLVVGTGINQAPIANPQSVSTSEDSSMDILLTGSDPDDDPITYTVVSTPTHGSLSGTAPNLSYLPENNYNGTDSFTFVVNDGLANSEPAAVNIEITPVNDAPVADSQSVTTWQSAPVAITLSGSDVDGDVLTYSVYAFPAHGTLSGTAPDLVYTPTNGYAGPDIFSFVVNDGELDSAPATVGIRINYLVFMSVLLR